MNKTATERSHYAFRCTKLFRPHYASLWISGHKKAVELELPQGARTPQVTSRTDLTRDQNDTLTALSSRNRHGSRGALSPFMGCTTARVLVIDDDEVVLRTISRLLRPLHRAFTASGPLEALALLEVTTFDAIICDQQMPEMSGTALASQLSARDASRVVFMTGGEEVLHNGYEVPNAILFKPFTRAELLAAIEAVLDSTAAA